MSRSRDTREFALAFHEVLRRYQFQDVEHVCEYGITLTECHALELVCLGGPLSVNEVAAGLRANKSTASRAVQSLAAKKLVERAVNDEDGRAWTLIATDAGRRLFETILEGSIRCYDEMLEGLSSSERKIALEVLRRLTSPPACRN